MIMRDRLGLTYASREDVKSALDVTEAARAEAQIDRVLASATDGVEGLLGRRFYPEVRSQTFRWPDALGALGEPYTVWLDRHEVVSVSSVVSGTTIVTGEYHLKPDDGPPYTRLELDTVAGRVFDYRAGAQNAITITGVFGYTDRTVAAGALAAAVSSAAATTLDVTDGSLIGVGDGILIGTERMVVTGRAFLDTGVNLNGAVTAASTAAVTVSDGSGFHPEELILVGAERMLITDIAGNTLAVKRAQDSTTLAAHADAADIYASRRLTVTRGTAGTTAATHASAAAIGRGWIPPMVRDLTIAEAMAELLQERTAYARTIGAAEGEREARGTGLADLRKRTCDAYGIRPKARAS